MGQASSCSLASKQSFAAVGGQRGESGRLQRKSPRFAKSRLRLRAWVNSRAPVKEKAMVTRMAFGCHLSSHREMAVRSLTKLEKLARL